MILFKKAKDLSRHLQKSASLNQTIGFVPTMGAIHAGHLSLVQASKPASDVTVCSVFVNPAQFNNKSDLEKYPVMLEKDIESLIKIGCDVLFIPSVTEVYPSDYKAPAYDLGPLETTLEGEYRPGHFQGVCQVVDRLLRLVNPRNLYLGQKDYQQCKVIERLLHLTHTEDFINTTVVPTLRENDGLAMSSRNLRLTKAQRKKAPAIYRSLIQSRELLTYSSVESVTDEMTAWLRAEGFRVDYFTVVDAETLLLPLPSAANLVILVAAWLDDIRLIDNLPVTKAQNSAD